MKKLSVFLLEVIFILSVIPSSLMAQESKTLTGKVLDYDTGEPIPISFVMVKGYDAIGEYTDINGNFIIKNVPKEAEYLVVSSTGFITAEIAIGTTTNFEIKLKADLTSLNEVIITALGIQRQAKEVGYATAKVSSEDLTKTKVMDATEALIGKVSGLEISMESPLLDAAVRVNLRGSRSFKGNNQALLVLDGVPTPLNYLQSLNPNDIESISVLKGASAAALYGSSAANGVLYVTTKTGEHGRPRITISQTTSFDKLSYFPKYQKRFGSGAENGTTGFGYYIKDENQQYGPEFDGSVVPIGQPIMTADGEIKQLEGTYDFKKGSREGYYKTGVTLQNNVSYSSGGEKGSFFLSFQNAVRTGTIVHDRLDRNTVRFNASKTYKNFKASANVAYSNVKINMNNSGSNGMWALWNTPANIYLPHYKDWRNVEGADPNSWNNSYYLNPYAQIDLYRREARSDLFSLSCNLEYKPLKWLRFQARAGTNIRVRNNNSKDNPWHYSDFAKISGRSYANEGDIYTALSTSSSYNNRLHIDVMSFAEHKFGKNFGLKGMLGWSLQNNYYEYKLVSADQIAIDNLWNVNHKMGELGGDNSWSLSRRLSLYASLDFSFFGWTYLQVTGRNDWTSLLDPSNWSFFYPGANLSIMLSDAIPYLKNNKWLSYLKLRGTFARVGSVNIDVYNLEDIANVAGHFPFGSLTAYTMSSNIRNRHIKPEFTTEFETGLELGLLKDRITFEAAYYHQTTNNQTVNISIPRSTGANTKYINAGVMTGQGVELDLKLTPMLTFDDFDWNFNANATFYSSKVSELYGNLEELAIYEPIYAIKGKPYPYIKATDYKRDPEGRVIVNPKTGYPYLGDLKPIGTTEPNTRIGLSSTLRWKGISLFVTFDYRGGHYIRFDSESDMLFSGTSYISTVSGRQRFVFPNSVIEVKNPDGSISYEENKNITVESGNKAFWAELYYSCVAARVVSAAAWKLRELSLTYEFPEKWMEKSKFFQHISIGLVCRNLFIWTPKTNIWGDPEVWSGVEGNMNAPGIAGSMQSGSRTFGFNVLMSF